MWGVSMAKTDDCSVLSHSHSAEFYMLENLKRKELHGQQFSTANLDCSISVFQMKASRCISLLMLSYPSNIEQISYLLSQDGVLSLRTHTHTHIYTGGVKFSWGKKKQADLSNSMLCCLKEGVRACVRARVCVCLSFICLCECHYMCVCVTVM